MGYSNPGVGVRTNKVQGSVIGGRMRSAMISLDRMVGWFPHTPVEWIELIIVALLLWLLMMVGISELEVIPI